MVQSEIGRRIEARMEALKWKVPQLFEKTVEVDPAGRGVAESTLRAWIYKGAQPRDMDALALVAKALGCRLVDLIPDASPPVVDVPEHGGSGEMDNGRFSPVSSIHMQRDADFYRRIQADLTLVEKTLREVREALAEYAKDIEKRRGIK